MSDLPSDGYEILAALRAANETTLVFNPLGLGGRLSPEDSARFLARLLKRATLNPDVPDSVTQNFERLRRLFMYGVLEYQFFTAADDAAYLVLEGALRHRFVSYYAHNVPVITDGVASEIVAPSFREYRLSVIALRGSGSKLRLREQQPEGLPVALPELWKWAQKRRLLIGQRNVGLFGSITDTRNDVAHPEHYTLGTPIDAIRTLADAAEIINRLWGHDTESGRLFPTPIPRRYRCAAISPDGTQSMTFGSLPIVPQEKDTDGWTYAVYVAAEREDLTEFDWSGAGGQRFRHQPGFQLTTWPTEVAWGPGAHVDLVAELPRFIADAPVDYVEFLDRAFFIRTLGDAVELPRNAADVIAFHGKEEEAMWQLIRADFPLDAFVYVRDKLDERTDVRPGVTRLKRFQGDAAARRVAFAIAREETGTK
jgi:hypothetical protein